VCSYVSLTAGARPDSTKVVNVLCSVFKAVGSMMKMMMMMMVVVVVVRRGC